VGPVEGDVKPRRFETDPLRVEERHAIVTSSRAGAASAAELTARLAAAPEVAAAPITCDRGARNRCTSNVRGDARGRAG
jgi:hypothetical protein